MKIKSILLTLLIMVSSLSHADTEINWLEYEDARALKSDKPIFVFGEMRFCQYCQQMKAEVFTQEEIINTLNNDFIPVKHSSFISGKHKFKDLKDKEGKPLKLVGSPLIMVVEGDKYRYGFGFRDAEQLMTVLKSSMESTGP